MKNIGLSVLLLLSISVFSQKLKTVNTTIKYDGYFMGKPTGNATFTCYEDENMNDVRHGKFSFSYNEKADINVAFIDDIQARSFTAYGNYKNGLKDGTWVFNMVDKNVFDGYKYYSGTLKLTANFKEGKPNGSWVFSEIWNTKVIQSYSLVSSGKPQINRSIIANFNMGTLTGKLNYTTSEDNSKTSISFDDAGFITTYEDETDTYKEVKIYENNYFIKNIYKNKATGKASTVDNSTDIEDYKLNPEKYYLDTTKMDYFQKYFWDKFTRLEFNFKNWDNDFPTFNGGYYIEVKNMPAMSIEEIISNEENKCSSYGLTRLFTNLKANMPAITINANEEKCLNYLNCIEKFKPILFIEPGFVSYNNGNRYLISDYESDIVVLDTLFSLIERTYINLKTERLYAEKLEKELQYKIEENSDLSNYFKKNDSYISSKCLTLKENSHVDLSVVSPNRCISSVKKYQPNFDVYDCLMINKKQMNIWSAYSIIIQSNKYLKKTYRIETLEKELNGNVFGEDRRNKEEELDNLKHPKTIAIATEDNDNLTSIINLQKKLIVILKDEKITKSINKQLKDMSNVEQIKKIIFQSE